MAFWALFFARGHWPHHLTSADAQVSPTVGSFPFLAHSESLSAIRLCTWSSRYLVLSSSHLFPQIALDPLAPGSFPSICSHSSVGFPHCSISTWYCKCLLTCLHLLLHCKLYACREWCPHSHAHDLHRYLCIYLLNEWSNEWMKSRLTGRLMVDPKLSIYFSCENWARTLPQVEPCFKQMQGEDEVGTSL